MKLKTLLISSLALLFAACTKDSAEITCSGVNGYQSEAISVSEEPVTLTATGEGDTQTLTLTVKMTAKDRISGISQLSPENIKLDDDFRVVLSTDGGPILRFDSDSSKTAFIELLKADKGKQAEIKFSQSFTKDVAQKILKDTEHFRVENLNVDLTNITLSGSVGKYPVCMTINVKSSGELTGAYYYTRQGPGALLYFKSNSGWSSTLTIPEFDINANNTGTFVGKFENDVFSGQFTTRGKTYIYSLKPDPSVTPLDLSGVPFDSFELPRATSSSSESSSYDTDYSSSYDTSGSSGSVDFDELLDSYERCIDKAISMMKKAENDDPTFMAEYQKYVSEMLEFSEKLQNAKGDLSASQLQRLNKLVMKAAKASQQ